MTIRDGRGIGIATLGVLLAALLAAACEGEGGREGTGGVRHRGMGGAARLDTAGLASRPVPAELKQGEALFAARCASCHGRAALGSRQGPPLIHAYYEPGHHADMAFHLAVVRGVRAHHWRFGDMAPVPGVSPEQVGQIVGYVRWLQRQAGVY